MLLTLVLMISVGIKWRLPRSIGYQGKGNDHLRLGNNCQDQYPSQDLREELKKSRLKNPLSCKKTEKVSRLGASIPQCMKWGLIFDLVDISTQLVEIGLCLLSHCHCAGGWYLCPLPAAISKIIWPGALVQWRPSGWTETEQLMEYGIFALFKHNVFSLLLIIKKAF